MRDASSGDKTIRRYTTPTSRSLREGGVSRGNTAQYDLQHEGLLTETTKVIGILWPTISSTDYES